MKKYNFFVRSIFNISIRLKIKSLKLFIYFVFVCFIILSYGCRSQKLYVFQPLSGDNDNVKQNIQYNFDDIIETSGTDIPDWLYTYLSYNIQEVENLEYYSGRYCFIVSVEYANISMLKKWAENFSIVYNFPPLAAIRIENKMISLAVLYPDDEYGVFFETMVKNAYNFVYPDVHLEDSIWLKKKYNNQNDENRQNNITETYEYFILISIDKNVMRNIIEKMMEETYAAVKPNRAQINSIKRLQLNFFEGF